MATDLIPAFLTFKPELFRSFLAGYCKAGFLSLDQLYTDYTDTLLGFIGGNPVSLPRPRPPVVNLDEILNPSPFVLDVSCSQCSWKCNNPSRRESVWHMHGREFMLTGLVSLLCGVDVAEFVLDGDAMQTADDPRVVPALLRAMLQLGYGNIDNAAGIPEIEIVSRLAEQAAARVSSKVSNGYVNGDLLNNLATALTIVQREWLPPFADAMIDVGNGYRHSQMR
jgi:hypothetical protein